MASNVLSASRPGAGSVVVTGSGRAITAPVVGIGVLMEVSSGAAPGAGAGTGGVARFMMRRRTMQMINDNPRLARKLGIRGKLQILE